MLPLSHGQSPAKLVELLMFVYRFTLSLAGNSLLLDFLMVVYKLQWSPRLGTTMKSRMPKDIRGLRNHHRLLLDQSLWSPKTFILTASFTQVSSTPSCRLLLPFSAWFHNHCKSLQWNPQTNPALYAAISSIYRFLNWIDGLLARMCSAKWCSPAIYIYSNQNKTYFNRQTTR